MKKIIAILAATTIMAGCSTPPVVQEIHPEILGYAKVINVREYTLTIAEPLNKTRNTKELSEVNKEIKDEKKIEIVELLLTDEKGPTYTIEQEKNANYYMGQRVEVTKQGNKAKVTPYNYLNK